MPRQSNLASHKLPSKEVKPSIGIITALPKEYAAVRSILENSSEKNFSGSGAGRRYLMGRIPATDGGYHRVVLMLLPEIGSSPAAIGATMLLEYFPSVNSIVMVGIAGGIPNRNKPDEHVRLGDIVVSNRNGIVQYDYIKDTITEIIFRHPPRPPSAKLLEAVRFLEANRISGQRPWLQFIDLGLQTLNVTRPSEVTDILGSSVNAADTIRHPQDPEREKDQPKLFYGPIASANLLLKNPHKRDELRDRFGVRAVEMEGSGIADATWNHEVGYLVVRGICDYCDANKSDNWQAYAAIVAAAYARALIESMPSQPDSRRRIWSRRIAALAVPSIAIGMLGFAGILSSQDQTAPKYQLYIESKMLPVEVYCDNHYWKTLSSDTPATTIDLSEGDHLILAKWGEFRYEERISISRHGPSAIVIIPPASNPSPTQK